MFDKTRFSKMKNAVAANFTQVMRRRDVVAFALRLSFMYYEMSQKS